MIALLWFVLAILASPFKAKSRLAAENVVLRHQLVVLRRMVHGRIRLTNNDRLFFVQLYRWIPSVLKVITIIRPETIVRWHRSGFRVSYGQKPKPVREYNEKRRRVQHSLADLKRSYTLKLFAGGEEAKELFASLSRELAAIVR